MAGKRHLIDGNANVVCGCTDEHADLTERVANVTCNECLDRFRRSRRDALVVYSYQMEVLTHSSTDFDTGGESTADFCQ